MKNAHESLDVSRLQQVVQHNEGRRDMQFNIGDLVLRRTHHLSDAVQGFTASLADKWQRPYRVSAKVSRLSYKLAQIETGDECGTINVNGLKRFFERSQESDTLQVPMTADPDSLCPASATLVHRYMLRSRR